jgi:NADH dehydrogenase
VPHVSGIRADAASPSLYIRKRGEGELAVRAAKPQGQICPPFASAQWSQQ